METIQAIYDGNTFKALEPIPVKGSYEVTITFNKPVIDDVEAKIKVMESFCGIFDEDDVKLIEQMKEEQRNLPKRSRDYDIS